MKLVLVLVLVLGCKTDDANKPAPKQQGAAQPTSAPSPTASAPAEPEPPPPTKSQKALETRMAVLGKVAIAAKKHQGDCKALSDAAVALGNDVRATIPARSDLDENDAAIERRQMGQVLSVVLTAAKGCETKALDPLTDQLTESAPSK